MTDYSLEDISASHQWLGHRKYTELVALHPDYRPGREHHDHNKKNDAYPKTAYARTGDEVARFVRRHHGARMVCYSLNERPRVLKNQHGYLRAATEKEIETARNALFDIDFENKNPTPAQKEALREFLEQGMAYFHDLGLIPPVIADSGRGYHLLFAYPDIHASEVPDFSRRLRKFCLDFGDDHKSELADLEAKLDHTQDLRRMVKIYGTAKPGVPTRSQWLHEGERIEDEQLRVYLLGLNLEPKAKKPPSMTPRQSRALSVATSLPKPFLHLLDCDPALRNLWQGQGKPQTTDTSRSGYDYSLAKRLLELGYTNVDDLAVILALRPDGAFREGNKDEKYLRRTIANALMG